MSSYSINTTFTLGVNNNSVLHSLGAKNLIQKVKIDSVIKNKPNMYFDRKLVNNFDHLAEKGYHVFFVKFNFTFY